MITDLQSFKKLLKDCYPQTLESKNGLMSVRLDENAVISVAFVGSDINNVIIRMRVVELKDIRRAGDFAKAVLAGNFYWSGTNGATLSIGPDNVLYLTDRRVLDEFTDRASLKKCFDDFVSTVSDWQIRSQLYA